MAVPGLTTKEYDNMMAKQKIELALELLGKLDSKDGHWDHPADLVKAFDKCYASIEGKFGGGDRTTFLSVDEFSQLSLRLKVDYATKIHNHDYEIKKAGTSEPGA